MDGQDPNRNNRPFLRPRKRQRTASSEDTPQAREVILKGDRPFQLVDFEPRGVQQVLEVEQLGELPRQSPPTSPESTVADPKGRSTEAAHTTEEFYREAPGFEVAFPPEAIQALAAAQRPTGPRGRGRPPRRPLRIPFVRRFHAVIPPGQRVTFLTFDAPPSNRTTRVLFRIETCTLSSSDEENEPAPNIIEPEPNVGEVPAPNNLPDEPVAAIGDNIEPSPALDDKSSNEPAEQAVEPPTSPLDKRD